MEMLANGAWQGIGAIIAIVSLAITVYDRKSKRISKDYFYIPRALGFFVIGLSYSVISLAVGMTSGFILLLFGCPPIGGDFGAMALDLSNIHLGYWGFGGVPALPRQTGALGLWMGMPAFGFLAVYLGISIDFRLDKLNRDYLVAPIFALCAALFIVGKGILIEFSKG